MATTLGLRFSLVLVVAWIARPGWEDAGWGDAGREDGPSCGPSAVASSLSNELLSSRRFWMACEEPLSVTKPSLGCRAVDPLLEWRAVALEAEEGKRRSER